MTDKEIIKALECCASEQCDCDDCPINDYCREHSDEMIKQMLDLINRLKADNERLNGNLKFVRGTVERQKAEKERLKTVLDIWQAGYASMEKGVRKLEEQLATAKSEAYKAFAERLITERLAVIALKGKSNDFAEGFQSALNYVEEQANNLLKEMG